VLSEFDEGKRSCRRRLAGHNERRRKLQPDAQNPAALSSRSSSPMHTDAFHMHGAAVSLSLEDCRHTQLLQQIRGTGGIPATLDDDEEHSIPFLNGANLSSCPPWSSDENVRAPSQQHQQVGGKEEGHSIFLDQHHHHHHFSSPSNRLLMFLQSPDSQMQGGLYPSLDVAFSNLSPPPLGSSHEFVDGGANKRPSSSLGQNLSLGGFEDDYHNMGCDDSQISGRALSLLSWGTPCPPAAAALDLSIDHTNLEYLVPDNTCSNLASSFTNHLHHHHHHQQQQPQEQYLALEKLYQVQSAGLGGMEVSESSGITDSHPLEQSTQLQHAGGTTSGNFLSSLGGLGLDAANSMLALFQSSNELEGIPSCGVSRSAHQISKATSDLVHTRSLQVHHHQQHFHEVRASVHLQTQTNSLNGEFGEFGSLQQHCERSLFSSTQQQML
jgi:hypothetical protein